MERDDGDCMIWGEDEAAMEECLKRLWMGGPSGGQELW